MNGEGSPLPAKEATLTLSLPERGIEPFERKAVLGADGYLVGARRADPRCRALAFAHRRFGDGFREDHARRANSTCPRAEIDFRDSFHKAAFAP